MDYKRILAVGDIHGMYDKLIALIEQVQFSPVEDLLIFLGDYIDRGPQSLECLDYVMIHELTHLIVPNHGREFKAHMDRFYPNWREVRKLLNNQSHY